MSDAAMIQTEDLRHAPRRVSELAPKIDRLPPHSIEAEQGVFGCILLSPKECIPEVMTRLKAIEEVFYDLRHRTLWVAILEMYDTQPDGIDVLTVAQWLKDRQQLEGIGGLGYLSSLPDAVPSAANLEYYCNIVFEKYLLRKLLQTATDIAGQVYEYEGDLDELIDQSEARMSRISQLTTTQVDFSTKELVNRAINKIEEYHQNKGMMMGLATGFPDFDKQTCGLQEGEMIVIAARPSIGKTSLAMNIAEHVVLELKQPVGVFSLEMTADALMMRMLCSRARVNVRKIRDGFLAERDFPKLTSAAGKIAQSPLHVDDSSGLSILQLKAKARHMWQQYGIKLFVIDYLQLLHSTSRRAENRQQEISEISGGLKSLAKELKVPVLVLSQLNRELEKRGPGERPRMSDLRESGSIEQDADVIGLLYKEKIKDDEVEGDEFEQDAIPVKLFIAKQRNGPIGDVDLTFLKSYTRFESAAKVSHEDVPAET